MSVEGRVQNVEVVKSNIPSLKFDTAAADRSALDPRHF